MKNQKLAVFDWNGTLIADTKHAWRASIECLAFYDRPPITFERQLETFDFPIIHYYKRNGCDIDQVIKTKDEANEIFQSNYENMAASARSRRGAKTLLKWLNDNDVNCIILSNYIENKITPHLERLDIQKYFSFISANTCNGTTVLNTTNKLERLSDYMVKRGYHPSNVSIIGDSMEEPDIARHLGITSIGITGGCINEKRLRAARPDHVVSSLSQTIDILKKKWGI